MKKEISSTQNPLVKHLIQLRDDTHYRAEQQALLVEGSKMIEEIRPHIKRIFYTDSYLSKDLFSCEQWKISEGILQKISRVNKPEGILAEVYLPHSQLPDACKRLLVLDGVSDPGNMGTLLRSALAFGWEGVFVVEGSCDPYNDKVLRAAKGAHFKLPIKKGTTQELLEWLADHHFDCYVADLAGQSIEDIQPSLKTALVLGNEGHGPSVRGKFGLKTLTIPMRSAMESLNVAVAGGILLYSLNKNGVNT